MNRIKNYLILSIELLFWIFFIIVFLLPFIESLAKDQDFFLAGRKFRLYLYMAGLEFFGLFIFYIVFNDFPLGKVAKHIKNLRSDNIYESDDANTHEKTSEEYLAALVIESRQISSRVLLKSNVFLVVGSLVALAGIFYFITNAPSRLSYKGLDHSAILLKVASSYGPHLGILFFVEFIAFFMFRQFRLLTDDYKYFEAIKRDRQSNLAIFKIANDESHQNWKEIVVSSSFFREPFKLSQYESTEILESKKLSEKELDILGKISNLIKTLSGRTG